MLCKALEVLETSGRLGDSLGCFRRLLDALTGFGKLFEFWEALVSTWYVPYRVCGSIMFQVPNSQMCRFLDFKIPRFPEFPDV